MNRDATDKQEGQARIEKEEERKEGQSRLFTGFHSTHTDKLT